MESVSHQTSTWHCILFQTASISSFDRWLTMAQRLRRFREGKSLRPKFKKRSISLDETVKSLNSISLASEADDFCESSETCHRRQGALSKATSVLFRRRIATESLTEEDIIKERVVEIPQEEDASSQGQSVVDDASISKIHPAPSQDNNNQTDPAVHARQQAIRVQQRLLGKHHPDVLFSLECLIRFHRERGEHQEALVVFEEKQRLSRESYWNRQQQGNVVVAHE